MTTQRSLFSAEVRERASWVVLEPPSQHDPLTAAIRSIIEDLGWREILLNHDQQAASHDNISAD